MIRFYILDFSEVIEMKKSDFITLLSFVIIIVTVIIVLCMGSCSVIENKGKSNNATDIVKINRTDNSVINSSKEQKTTYKKTSESTENNKDISMKDALFIGDSRTVGISEYGEIKGADFFVDVGMSVYNINKKSVSVQNVGRVTLNELLINKKYDKIYLMLGINDVGCDFNITMNKYKEILNLIQTKQPDSIIFVQANLHVTKSRSDSDKYVNNKAIDRINTAISKLADGRKIFYLDANVLFDDGSRNLSSDKSEDTAHLYAKYYSEWGKWIINQTSLLIPEG